MYRGKHLFRYAGANPTFGSNILSVQLVPDQFAFIDQVDVPLSTFIVSNLITPTGVTPGHGTPISVSGVASSVYRINGGLWTNVEGEFFDGDDVEVGADSSDSGLTDVDTTLFIGPPGLEVSDTFTSTTEIVAILSAPWDGLVIPPNSLLYQDGAVQGDLSLAGDATTCETGRTMILNEFVGFKFRDTSDNSWAIITGNTITGQVTFSGGLSGGVANLCAADHYWEIVIDLEPLDLINVSPTTPEGGTVSVNEKGIPLVTGPATDHTVTFTITNISPPFTTPSAQMVINIS